MFLFAACCFSLAVACKAGLFYDVKSFIGNTISKRRSLAKYSNFLEPTQPSPEEIIADLKSENSLLHGQVGALKSVVVFQKKQLFEARKEKEALRRLLNSQVDDLTKRIEIDTEKIKQDLMTAFEEEKDVLIATFEEEKEAIKEEHAREVEDLRDELMKRVDEKSSEAKSLKKMTVEQAKEIVEFKRRQTEALKVIYDFLLNAYHRVL
jgi:hypothetical protein